MFLWSGDVRLFSIFIVTYKDFQTLQTATITCQDFMHCSKILVSRNGVTVAVLVRISVNINFPRCNSMQTFIHCHVTLHVSGVPHPSSGALKTVSATSGVCHGNGISLAFIFLVFPCKMLHKNKIFAIDKILIKYLLLGLYF